MMIEAREWPLRRIYPMNIMIMDMSMNRCLNSSVQHLSLSSVSWVNSQGSDTTPVHKLTPQLESLITTCGDFQISLDKTSQLLFKNTPFDFRSFNSCMLQSDSTRILPCKSLEAPGWGCGDAPTSLGLLYPWRFLSLHELAVPLLNVYPSISQPFKPGLTIIPQVKNHQHMKALIWFGKDSHSVEPEPVPSLLNMIPNFDPTTTSIKFHPVPPDAWACHFHGWSMVLI